MKYFTPGPWRSNESAVVCNFGAVAVCADMDGHHVADAAVISTLFTYQQACEHADLIARAPALLAENERLQKVIKKAPHDEWCQLRRPLGPSEDCDCWKAAALKVTP